MPRWMHQVIEILIVVLLTAIIAAYVKRTFFPTHTGRSPVSRVRSDMRSLATAIEAYYADHHSYPAMRPLRELVKNPNALRKAGGWNLMTIEPGRPGLAGLTTPVAYITTLFTDDFVDWPYAYYSNGQGWILISPGWDGYYDLSTPETLYNPRVLQPSAWLVAGPWTYDPTNGTKSSGDIWRVRQ